MKNNSDMSLTLGAWLRQLRSTRKLPLRMVAAATEIDSTLLSKIELGQRLPTEVQTKALTAYFKIPFAEMEAKRLAERFMIENASSPAVEKAALLIKEAAGEYRAANSSRKT